LFSRGFRESLSSRGFGAEEAEETRTSYANNVQLAYKSIRYWMQEKLWDNNWDSIFVVQDLENLALFHNCMRNEANEVLVKG